MSIRAGSRICSSVYLSRTYQKPSCNAFCDRQQGVKVAERVYSHKTKFKDSEKLEKLIRTRQQTTCPSLMDPKGSMFIQRVDRLVKSGLSPTDTALLDMKEEEVKKYTSQPVKLNQTKRTGLEQ